jgi:hypothetical protein
MTRISGRSYSPPQCLNESIRVEERRLLDFLGAQVGLDLKTITDVVDDLQRQSIVVKTRHTVAITDHDRLTATCCDCFALCKEATQQYVAALQDIARANRGE